jgi:hypothetical protein
VAIRVLEIDATPAVVVINLTFLGSCRIGPEGKASFLNSPKDLIELRFTNKKRIVLRRDLAILVHEVDIYSVLSRDDLKRPQCVGPDRPNIWARKVADA